MGRTPASVVGPARNGRSLALAGTRRWINPVGGGRYGGSVLTRGVLLGDRYRLGERVATGGMGAVWRGTDVLLEREVAVKVLLPSLVTDPEFTARFRAEARMLAALRHPGVVPVHDVGQAALADGSRVDYLVMEYVEGEPLSARVRAAGRLDAATTMSVLSQAAEALHTAHLAGIVHRDVKPGNLLVKADGTVVLVDFGIARSRAMAGLTAANMVLGTASYMSPEQATGQPVSAATDIYALGAVAYFCLAGQPPFHGDNPLAVALRHAQEEPAPLPPETPPAVTAVVARALGKRPADRFGSAAELAAAAADARDSTLASIPVSARPPWAIGVPPAPNATPPVPAATPHRRTDQPTRRAGPGVAGGGGPAGRAGAGCPAPTGEPRGRAGDRTGADPGGRAPDRADRPTPATAARGRRGRPARAGRRGGRDGTAAPHQRRRGRPAARAGRRVGGGHRRRTAGRGPDRHRSPTRRDTGRRPQHVRRPDRCPHHRDDQRRTGPDRRAGEHPHRDGQQPTDAQPHPVEPTQPVHGGAGVRQRLPGGRLGDADRR